MFFETLKENEHSLLFLAAFHLGLPLAICQTDKSKEWLAIREEIVKKISSKSNRFEVIPFECCPTQFPLGDPCSIRDKDFFCFLNLPQYITDYFKEQGLSIDSSDYLCDNQIWICPTGIILIIGKISFKTKKMIDLKQFSNNIVENRYAELAFIFSEIAQIIFEIFPDTLYLSSLVCQQYLRKYLDTKEYYHRKIALDRSITNLEIFFSDQYARKIFNDILIDVYYIEFIYSEKKKQQKLRIDYDDASIISSDPHHVFIQSLTYSSFPAFIWITDHLRERSQFLQELFNRNLKLNEMVIPELKIFRIFCLRFANESHPISIRLTRRYMEQIEEFWQKARLYNLNTQVDEQLTTIETTLSWIDEIKKESRNFKVGLAATFIAIISLASVAAQLISTIDYQNYIDASLRICLITLGVVIGIIIGVLIYEWPTRFGLKR